MRTIVNLHHFSDEDVQIRIDYLKRQSPTVSSLNSGLLKTNRGRKSNAVPAVKEEGETEAS